MLRHHERVVHFVDVVAGEDEAVLGFLGTNRVDVLENGIGGALIPALRDALHGRKNLDELTEFTGDDRTPALADVAIETEGLVLGEDVDLAEVGVDAVGKGDVDDAILPGKRYGRLGAVAGERKQTFAGSTGKQNTQRISHETQHLGKSTPCDARFGEGRRLSLTRRGGISPPRNECGEKRVRLPQLASKVGRRGSTS